MGGPTVAGVVSPLKEYQSGLTPHTDCMRLKVCHLIYVPSGSDSPLGNPQNSVSFWQKWHTQIGLREERVLVASSG